MTPPRNQDRAGDDELVAPVIALRRRGAWDVDPRDLCPPAPEYTFFDAPDDPAPILSERNIWDGRPVQLRLRQPQPAPSEVLERPRHRARHPPRERLATPQLLAAAAALALLAAVAAIASLGGGHLRAARDQSQPTRADISAAAATATALAAVPARGSSPQTAAARARPAGERSLRHVRGRELAGASRRAAPHAAAALPTAPPGGNARSSSAWSAPSDVPSSSGDQENPKSSPTVAPASSVTDPNRCVPGDLAC